MYLILTNDNQDFVNAFETYKEMLDWLSEYKLKYDNQFSCFTCNLRTGKIEKIDSNKM